MYGQMTAGSWIYIGSQGIVQGTYETFGAVAREHFGGIARRPLRAHRGPRRHGRRAAARRDDARRGDARRRSRRVAHRQAARDAATAIARRATLDEALALDRRGARAKRRALSVGLVGNAADVLPELVGAASTPDVLTDQTSAHDMLQRLRPRRACRSTRRAALRAARSRRRTSRARTASIVAHVRAMLELQRRGAVTFDYGNNIRTVAFDAGVDGRVRHSRASCPSTSVRCSARGRARSAGSRCRAIRRTSRRTDELVLELFPDDEHLRRWITLARERIALPGAAGAHLLAGAGRARAVRRRAQRPRRERRAVGADRDRARPSRHRQRRVAVPRDGGDEGRQRRDRRLADPQRAAQRRERRVVGVVPSWRRRRHRQLAARRPGDRRRRHAGDARAPRARADERSRASASRATPTPATRPRVETARAATGIVASRSVRLTMLSRALQALARSALPRASTPGWRRGGGPCSCTSRSRCAATRAAASATTGRRRSDGARRRARSRSPTRRASSIRCWSRSPAASRCCGATSRTSSRPSTRAVRLKYITLSPTAACSRRARASLWDAGHQPVQHLARLPRRAARRGARHSRARRAKIFAHVDGMRARGIDNIRFNTVIKDDNLDSSCPSSSARAELGCGVNFSVYTDAKNGNRDHLVAASRCTRSSTTPIARAARLQAAAPRRDHELGLLPRADPALRARRDDRALPVGMRTIHIDPAGPREALPGFPDRLPLARLPSATSRSTATPATTPAAARRRRRCDSRACAT